ncbi:MAG: Nif3-like dinuclear metal center hexameric protein [Ignavibacteriales bacterium]|nr:Nif3-like dinuclear metal center hexameric protein [Ignavibacteriales bacterium]
MTVADFAHILEQWAPRWIAWERDNVGLQVGERGRVLRRIHLCLDVTKTVVEEAVRKKADLIFSHHPLLFRRPASITDSDEVGNLILLLARKNIAVYSAHTNLDFTRGGVSFALADVLGLENVRFLSPLKDLLVKIAVFVPDSHLDAVLDAMADAGAGTIGEYSHCSFQLRGKGTFRGSEATNPFLGRAGVLETAEETRLEMILPRARVPTVVGAMKGAHPYEEVAYDVYALENESTEYGAGAIGELPSPVRLGSFLKKSKEALSAESFRFSGEKNSKVRRVAVCGGSGSDLLPAAMQAEADVFVTADIRYHTYHDAQGRISLVDAGHWETEQIILPVVARRLREEFKNRGEQIEISQTSLRTSPIHSY